ncbi:10841_t:CDS:2 [Funneliformis geosporum]|uniref:9798_t:CDS:1 n=1 Tax=Funneliformis geosporum TaxID=1117311 RepID=A0A9W4WW63_9GLOM|nr:9798_t:CDS:2 [Funneliformis geosporum]CAI2183048.1 10841_t:CDS:2 [Funneliformis geosporum]
MLVVTDLIYSFTVVIIIQTGIFVLIKLLFTRDKPYISNKKNLLPHPPTFPIVGNLLQLNVRPLEKLYQWNIKYGPIYSIKLGQKYIIILNNHEVVNDLIVKQGSKYSSKYNFSNLNTILIKSNSTAFTPYGNQWKRDRSIAYSALTSRPIKSYYNYILKDSDQLLKVLMMKHGQPTYPLQIFKNFVLTNMLNILFGAQIKGNDDPFLKDVMKVMDDITEFSYPTSVLNDLMPILKYVYQPSNEKAVKVYQQMENLFSSKYNEFLKDYAQGKNLSPSFLSQIQDEIDEKGKNSIEYEDVWQMLVGLLNGAMETEVNTLMWAVACLANNPGVQEEAFKEIDSVCDKNMPMMVDELDLPYINAIINETLRYRPPNAFGMIHLSSEDDDYNGYFIPKGTPILLNLFAINHNERRFIAPDRFRPSRFLSNSSTGSVKTKSILLPQFEYDPSAIDKKRKSLFGILKNNSPSLTNNTMPMHMSFGAGRRYCIGQHLAQKQLFLVLARILWAFEIKPDVNKDGSMAEINLNDGNVSLTSYSPSPYNVRFLLRKDIGLLI